VTAVRSTAFRDRRGARLDVVGRRVRGRCEAGEVMQAIDGEYRRAVRPPSSSSRQLGGSARRPIRSRLRSESVEELVIDSRSSASTHGCARRARGSPDGAVTGSPRSAERAPAASLGPPRIVDVTRSPRAPCRVRRDVGRGIRGRDRAVGRDTRRSISSAGSSTSNRDDAVISRRVRRDRQAREMSG